MGCLCQKFKRLFDRPQKQVELTIKDKEVPDTDRYLIKAQTIREDKPEQPQAKGSTMEVQSSSYGRDTKIFLRSKSTALFSSDTERRHSSILQFTLDYQSIIKPSQIESVGGNVQQYYTLIDKIALIRKTSESIHIISPDGQSQLHCPPQYLFSTLTVFEGRPVQIIEEVAPNKIIQIDGSPIKVNLKMKCKQCKKQLKITFCKGVMNLGVVQCPGCDSKDRWSIIDIESNAPVWGDGVKINNHQYIVNSPKILRVMGCVVCLKFSNCQKMKCGCLVCSGCLAAREDLSIDMQCRMCQGNFNI